jgi:hypothetical protein
VGDRAWPLTRLAEEGPDRSRRHDHLAAGKSSALDSAEIAEGRDVGQIRVRDGDGATWCMT